MDTAINTIKIEHNRQKVALTFRREIGNLCKVRYLRANEAIVLGLLLSADAPYAALKVDVSLDLSLQVINAPYEEAWLMVRDLRGGRTLVVGIEGKLVREIGKCLLNLGQFVSGSSARKYTGVFLRPISQCYLDEAGAR